MVRRFAKLLPLTQLRLGSVFGLAKAAQPSPARGEGVERSALISLSPAWEREGPA